MTDQAPVTEGQGEAPQGEGQALWYESAPDEVKGYIQNKGWDDPIKAVSSYQELEKYRGANENELLRLPKDPQAENAYNEIWDKLGRPESADKYNVELPEGANIDEGRLNTYRDVAYKAGITQAQFEALAQADASYMASMMEQSQKEIAQQQEADYQKLRREWGKDADEREELSRRGLRAIMPEGMNSDETIQAIEQAIGTAATLKLFANVGDRLAREDSLPNTEGDRPFGYTKEQALADKKSLMDELKSDRERLAVYNTGKGTDFEKMKRLNRYIAG